MEAAEDYTEDEDVLDSIADPGVTGGSPVPDDLDVPPSPVFEGPEAPINLDQIAATPSPVPAPAVPQVAQGVPSKLGTEDTIQRQGELDIQRAEADAASAEQQAQAAGEKDETARLAYADYLDRRKASEERLDALTKQFQEAKITNPRERTPKWKSSLSVIFGALGGGLAKDGSNVGLDVLKQKWKEDLDLQKANIDALKDKVIMARTGLKDVDEGRAQMQLAADAAYIARLNSAIKQGELQMKKLGVSQAAIETDKRLAALKADRAEAIMKARKAKDDHDLAQARAYYYRHGGAGQGAGAGTNALQIFVAAANALPPGAPISPEVAALGAKAGLKPAQIASEVDRYRNSDDKSVGGGKGPKNQKDLGDLDEGVRKLDRLIDQIEANPKAWDEYRENARAWAKDKGLRESAVGTGLQFFGAMKLRPEEGLKTPGARTLFQRQEQLNTSIAKGFGGVITEGDREAAAS
ncbi:MAG TPA: hypothetical protein VJ725_30985, partial [Thermoanaerobaculia bacterium]|nr:hypothetical protein [Thermoanaerobaculia bacterium]